MTRFQEVAVAYVNLNIAQWAEENFGTCNLGDVRRTRRAVRVAQHMAEYPDGSTPNQMERWSDLKAVYRLLDGEDVTFTALAEPHWQRTRAQARGVVLLLGDTTETDFGIWRDVAGLGPTGDGGGQGFFLHNSLAVEAATGEIIGLAGQELFYRQSAPQEENSYQTSQRSRESEVWGRVVDLIGPTEEGKQYIHVFDRGADNLEVFCRTARQQCDWVIRAAQLHRVVLDEFDRKVSVKETLQRQPVLGTYELQLRGTKGQPPRTACLEVRAATVTIPRPKRMTPFLKEIDFESLEQSVVEVREVNAPQGVKPLHWVLWTSLPVETFEQALLVIEYYERRWLIEEFHKAMKTGCRLESRQYATSGRLEAIAGFISVLAVRLVQLKTVARDQPNTPARHVVPRAWLEMLRALRKNARIKTVRDFFRHLAGLGGFLMRKGDGEPGWITIWRGTDKLLLALRGHYAMRKKCG